MEGLHEAVTVVGPGHTVGELAALLAVREPTGGEAVPLLRTCQDSRAVKPGDLYVALPGAHHHGAAFAHEAVARGAVAALSDVDLPGLPTLRVADPRVAAGPVAAWVHHHPSAALDVYATTGTNGKTSTTHLLHAALAGAGRRPGLMSGIEMRGPWPGRRARAARRTTPEADELQAELAALRDEGADSAALEVSSHALALHRVDGTSFAAATFTNLGCDHLDFHGDLEGYYAAKASLFHPRRARLAVVNIDDEHGRRLAETTPLPVVTFSATGRPADVRAEDVSADAEGSSFRLRGLGVDLPVRLRLLGAHQVDNALAALATALATGVEAAGAVTGVEALRRVPGRLERVEAGQPFLALVDYAHNTHGQERLFPYLRSLGTGRLHVVVGATGERDPGKRAPWAPPQRRGPTPSWSPTRARTPRTQRSCATPSPTAPVACDGPACSSNPTAVPPSPSLWPAPGRVTSCSSPAGATTPSWSRHRACAPSTTGRSCATSWRDAPPEARIDGWRRERCLRRRGYDLGAAVLARAGVATSHSVS